MNTLIRFFLFLCLSTILTSCIVTKKKYDDTLAQKIKAEGDLSDKTKQLDKANADLAGLNEKLKQLRKDTSDLGENYRASFKKLTGLTKEYDQLNSFYKNLLNNSGK